MSACAFDKPKSFEALEEIQMNKIMKMIKDKYSIIAISIGIILTCIFILFFFAKQLFNAVHKWKVMSSKYTAPSDFNEEYPDEPSKEMGDPINYYSEGKQKFVKNIKSIYKQYNREKNSYIVNTLKKPNDDVVDSTILFSKYDSYEDEDN